MERSHRLRYDDKQKLISVLDLSLELKMHPASLSRWVKLWSERDGTLLIPAGKRGAYRLPTLYRLVGRGWCMTQDAQVRDVMLKVLVADPKPYLVVVGNEGSTCYTAAQAIERATEALTPVGDQSYVSIFYVGDEMAPN